MSSAYNVNLDLEMAFTISFAYNRYKILGTYYV